MYLAVTCVVLAAAVAAPAPKPEPSPEANPQPNPVPNPDPAASADDRPEIIEIIAPAASAQVCIIQCIV